MTGKTMRRLEALEASVAGETEPKPDIRIVFVSPDGTKSSPKTLDELRQEFELRKQRENREAES